jgi:MOSC domain-containing protein YiiM
MHEVNNIRAIAGKGLEGDRYALQQGSWKKKGALEHDKKRNVTLIAIEALEAANEILPPQMRFLPEETRRNILTKGIDVNSLVGREFSVGPVLLLGVELADPCDRPDKLSGKKGFEHAFVNKGGLNAEILNEGPISVGDLIIVLPR